MKSGVFRQRFARASTHFQLPPLFYEAPATADPRVYGTSLWGQPVDASRKKTVQKATPGFGGSNPIGPIFAFESMNSTFI